jgi:hypothetical protein
MEQRFFEFCQQVWYTVRQGGNFFQPKIVRAVTSNGFEKRKLPAETYRWLKEWYEREQPRIGSKEKITGPSMNQHVAPSNITHLTSSLKDKLTEELRSILEDWYGGELVMTSIYGVR